VVPSVLFQTDNAVMHPGRRVARSYSFTKSEHRIWILPSSRVGPRGGSRVRQALDGDVWKPRKNRRQIIAHWEFQPTTAFHHRKSRSDLRSRPRTSDVDLSPPSDCDWRHGVLRQVCCSTPVRDIPGPREFSPERDGTVPGLGQCTRRQYHGAYRFDRLPDFTRSGRDCAWRIAWRASRFIPWRRAPASMANSSSIRATMWGATRSPGFNCTASKKCRSECDQQPAGTIFGPQCDRRRHSHPSVVEVTLVKIVGSRKAPISPARPPPIATFGVRRSTRLHHRRSYERIP